MASAWWRTEVNQNPSLQWQPHWEVRGWCSHIHTGLGFKGEVVGLSVQSATLVIWALTASRMPTVSTPIKESSSL